GTDATGRDVGLAGLVDLQPVHRLGGQLGEVECAGATIHAANGNLARGAERVGAGHLAAVEGDHVELRAKSARRNLRAFAVAAFDRDAGNTLKRLGEVGVRELADVLGAHRVHDAGGI